MPIRKAVWNTDDQFNYGVLTKTGVTVTGTGGSAFLELDNAIDNSDDVTFTTSTDFYYNPDEIEVIGGQAILKSLGVNTTKDFTFTTGGNYSYDTDKIEVTGGSALLVGVTDVYAQWHMNQFYGLDVPDVGPNGYDGTAQNITNADWVSGKLNNALNLSGVDERVDFGDIGNFERTDAFSTEFWLKTSSAATAGVIGRSTVPGVGWQVYTINTGQLRFILQNAAGNRIYVTSNATVTDGAWHHYVVTYDGSSTAAGITFYKDGSPWAISINQDNLSSSIQNIANFSIGSRNLTQWPLIGVMDEVLVYTKELTQAEVTTRWNSGSGTELEAVSQNEPTIVPKTGFVFAVALEHFTESITIPIGTEVGYHCSSDGAITWKYYDGAAWVSTDGTFAKSNDGDTIDTNIATLDSSGNFYIRALLKSDGTDTPEIDNIRVQVPTTYTTGDFEVAMKTDIQPTRVVSYLTASETATRAAGTDVKYQYSQDSGLVWNESWFYITELETSLQGLSPGYDGDDKLRLKMQLSTSVATSTPELDNVNITSDAGKALTGTYESDPYEPEVSWTNGVYLESIEFYVNVPIGTSLKIEARNVDNTLEQGYVEYDSGDSIQLCGQFAQWKGTFQGDGTISPTIEWVEMPFHTLVGVMRAIDEGIDDRPSVSEIADGVWDEPTAPHKVSGSFGLLTQKLLTLAKFVGLR